MWDKYTYVYHGNNTNNLMDKLYDDKHNLFYNKLYI